MSTEITNTSAALSRWWHPVARSGQLTNDPIRVELLGRAWVVARTGDGLMAMADRCPHRRAPLSAGRVVDDQLVCAYHGWRFGADGRCTLIPALGPEGRVPATASTSAAWGVTERYGLVWLAPEEPLCPIIDLAYWEDPTRSQVDMEVYHGRFGAALLIDNQLDMAHFPFLHAGTFGSPDAKIVPAAELDRQEWGFTVQTKVPFTAANDPAALRGERPITQFREMTYRYLAPFSLELRLDYPTMGGSTMIFFFAQPETESSCSLYVTLSFQQPGGFDEQSLADRLGFEYRILDEDMELQAKFDDLRLPLDPGSETHTRADKPSIEYRRILRELLAHGSTDGG